MPTIDLLPPGLLDTAFREDARAGLTAMPKSLPSKWFYDARAMRFSSGSPNSPGMDPSGQFAVSLSVLVRPRRPLTAARAG
jgi:hypothetical protein